MKNTTTIVDMLAVLSVLLLCVESRERMRLRVPSSCYVGLQDFVKECRNDDDGDNTNNCE